MTRRQLGARIKDFRLRRGWTQGEMAGMMVPPRTHAAISDIERGVTGLDIEEIAAVATLLGIDLPTLLGLAVAEVRTELPRTRDAYERGDAALELIDESAGMLARATAYVAGNVIFTDDQIEDADSALLLIRRLRRRLGKRLADARGN